MPSKKKAVPATPTLESMALASQQPPKISRSPDFASHYVNHTGLLATSFDLSLIFGRITSAEQGSPPCVEQFLQVTMSYQHAKAVVDVLSQHLLAYEKLPFTATKSPAQP